MKIIGITCFLLVITILIVFFTLILPNDHRVKSPKFELAPIRQKRVITHNLIDLSLKAKIDHQDYTSQYQDLLKNYTYINDNRDYHLIRENMHISLGWYPLRVVHQNSMFAPPATTISYELTLPKNKPRLEFSCGVISKPAEFIVKIIDPQNKEYSIFREKINPIKKFPFQHRDKLNKDLYQYLDVQMEDRDSKWHEYKIDLTPFAGQNMKLVFETKGDAAPAFWANPIITEETGNLYQKTNLIFVIIDSLRKDAVGINDLTPNLDKLANEGVSFEKAIANGNMTKQSVTSFLTSRLPFELGEVSLEYVSGKESRDNFYRSNVPTLATILNKNGYYTGSIGTVSLLTDGAGFGVDFGFNDTRIIERYGYSNVYITNEAVSWLGRYGDKPFGLLVYYDAPHGPYKPPFRYFRKALKILDKFSSEKWYRTLYEADVTYTDVYLGILLDAVEKLNLSSNTLIVVLSDHGENLALHKIPGSNKKVVFHDHGISLKEDDVNVPLIMRLPGKIPEGTKVKQTVQLLNLIPTIFDLMDIKTTDYLRGKSISDIIYETSRGGSQTAPTNNNEIIFMRGRFNKGVRIKDKYKYIRNFGVYDKQGKKMQELIPEELYDLGKDTWENNNIIDKEPLIRRDMQNILDGFEPDPEENIIRFSNPENKNIKGQIIAEGKIGSYSLDGQGEIKANSNILEFNITGKNVMINFATDPFNAEIKVDIKNEGKEIPLSKFLVGDYGLPVLNPGQKKLTREDFYIMKGVPPYLPAGEELRIYWGREAKYKLEWEKQKGVTGAFKDMMADWGYLSEPT
ncbi:MAG: sulfatase, partial [bacterium]|nr:sulfatase [bacterium]